MRTIKTLAWIMASLTLFLCAALAGCAYLSYTPAANCSLECAAAGSDWALGADLTLNRFGRVITQRLYPPQEMPPLTGLTHTQAMERLFARAGEAARAAGQSASSARFYFTVGAADAALARRLIRAAADALAKSGGGTAAGGAAIPMTLVHAARRREVSPARLYLAAGHAARRDGLDWKDENLRHALTLPLDELLRAGAPAAQGGKTHA